MSLLFLFLLQSLYFGNADTEVRCGPLFKKKRLEVRTSVADIEKTQRKFIVKDVLDRNIFWKAYLEDGVLSMRIQLKVPSQGYRSSLQGHKIYKEMMEHFGVKNIKKIESVWIEQTNFTQFFKNIEKGMSEKEAALNTWSGRQAKSYGFSKVSVEVYVNSLTLKKSIMIEFSRP